MVRRVQFVRPLAESMGEYLVWTEPQDPADNLTVLVLPAASVVSQEWA